MTMRDQHADERLTGDEARGEQHAPARETLDVFRRRPDAGQCPQRAVAARTRRAGRRGRSALPARAADRCRRPRPAPARECRSCVAFRISSTTMMTAPMAMPAITMSHGSWPPNMPLRHGLHQRGLRGLQRRADVPPWRGPCRRPCSSRLSTGAMIERAWRWRPRRASPAGATAMRRSCGRLSGPAGCRPRSRPHNTPPRRS